MICILTFNCRESNRSNQQLPERIMLEDYYENGQVKSRVWYKNGKEDSLGIWYYENGLTKVIAAFKNGNQVGPTNYYHSNGNLSAYYYHNKERSAMYGREYNSNGDLQEEKGKPIGLVFETTLIAKQGENFAFTVIAAKPPNTTMTLFILTKEGDPNFIQRGIYEVKDTPPYFQYYFEDKGDQPVMVVSELNDTIRNEIRRDTVSFIVTVE